MSDAGTADDPRDDGFRELQSLADEVRVLLREFSFLRIDLPIGVSLQFEALARRVGAR